MAVSLSGFSEAIGPGSHKSPLSAKQSVQLPAVKVPQPFSGQNYIVQSTKASLGAAKGLTHDPLDPVPGNSGAHVFLGYHETKPGNAQLIAARQDKKVPVRNLYLGRTKNPGILRRPQQPESAIEA